MVETGTRTGYAEVNGTRIHYELRGTGSPLLFLHGFTLDGRMWRRQVEVLARTHRVLTYDARGFGRSDLPGSEPYAHAQDAAALCDHLGLGRIVAVGHSIGAHQTLELALIRPDIVAGWVSLCASGLASVPFPDDVLTMFGVVRQLARSEGVEAALRVWKTSRWFAARNDPELRPEIDAMLDDYSGWHWTHDNPATNIDPPASERLGLLQAPALIVTGADDLPYNALVAERLAREIPESTSLRIENAGHMANLEAPDAVNAAIAAFATRVLTGAV